MSKPLPGLPGGDPIQPNSREQPASVPIFRLRGTPLKEGQRGVVLSSPCEMPAVGQFGPGGKVETVPKAFIKPMPSRLEVNQSLLLWDRIHVPEQMYAFGLPEELKLLRDEGLLNEADTINLEDVPAALGWPWDTYRLDKIWTAMRLALFEELERAAPGQWALGRGPRSSFLPEDEFAGRGLLVKLDNLMAVPSQEVAIEEVLSFREKRDSELRGLRSQLIQTFHELSQSDLDAMVRSDILERLKRAVEPYTRVVSETRFKKVWSSLSATMGYNFASGLRSAAGAFAMTHSVGTSLIASANGFTVSVARSLKKAKTTNPFEYVGQYRNDLPWVGEDEPEYRSFFS